MSTMTTDETYNGYANRETWAFNLHWSNDQELYRDALAAAVSAVEDDAEISDHGLGEAVVDYFREAIDEYAEDHGDPGSSADAMWGALRMMDREVGSWWRIDYREVGEAVREALEAESD